MKSPEPSTSEGAAPPPTFDAIALGSDVRKAIDAMGYVNPTPVQVAVFDAATRGKSLVVQARTGTGKTAAFGLPIVDTLVRRSQANVQALILCPTRELALQVSRELEQIAQFRGTKILAIYGGAPMGKQVSALQEGAQVVVGTPGRVLDHLRRGTFDASNVRIFVLDEADEMLSMGFAKELNAILSALPQERQGLYFSATIPPDVDRLAQSHLRDPEYVTLSSDQIGALDISHFVYLVREGDKRGALVRIVEVEDPESAVVFCNTKDETERVAEALNNRGYDADWLNGDLEQREREKVMARTREGKLRFLVATDVAARGIDISHLTHVINADFPESAEQYVHRTGRTGRAGRTGTAISLVGPKDVGHLYMLRLTYKIRPVERSLPTAGELKTRAEADVVAFLADAYAAKSPDANHLALARRLLSHDKAEGIVAGLLADHLGATSTEGATQEAAEARRAKNPAPVAASPEPQAAREPPRERSRDRDRGRDRARDDSTRDAIRPYQSPKRDATPQTLRGGERPPSAEGSRDRRGRRDEPRPPSLSSWEPPADADDDRPILKSVPPPEVDDQALTLRPAPRDGRSRSGRSGSGRPLPSSPGDVAIVAPIIVETRTVTEPDDASIFLNVGRRDGLRPEDVQRMLSELGGIPEAESSRVRVRDRMTFVTLRQDLAERAIAVLGGQVVGGRTVVAEPARQR